MLIELFTLAVLATEQQVLEINKALKPYGMILDPPINVTHNKDGTLTIEGPSDDRSRLGGIVAAIQKRQAEALNLEKSLKQIYQNNNFEFPDEIPLDTLIAFDYGKDNLINLRNEIKALQTEYEAIKQRMKVDGIQ